MIATLRRGWGRLAMRRIGVSAARRRARAAILWWAVGCVAAWAAFFYLRDVRTPTFVDPEYARKLIRFREKRTTAPAAQPVVALVGSSRTAMGIRPDVMWDDRPPADRPALVMNFGICGAGPVMHHVTLDRLLHDGVRPHTVVVEVWVPLMTETYLAEIGVGHLAKEMHRYRGDDAQLVGRYLPDPVPFLREWASLQVVPWQAYRQRVMRAYAPSWLTKEARNDATYRELDDWGFLTVDGHWEHPPADRFTRFVTDIRNWTTASLSPLKISPHLDRALRDLIALARGRNINVVVLLIPEPAGVREVYRTCPGGADAERYVRGLCAEFGATLVDARDWLPDTAFADGSHLTPAGAAEFARCLQRRVFDAR